MVNKILVFLLLVVSVVFICKNYTYNTTNIAATGTVQIVDVKSDGYYFEKPSFAHPVLNQRIYVVLVPNQEEMKRLYKEKTGHVYDTSGKKIIMAFSFPDAKTKTCVLYIPDPRVNYRPEFIGHELTHCIFGYWHPTQK